MSIVTESFKKKKKKKKASSLSYFFEMIGRVFRLSADNMGNRDRLSEQTFVLFVTVFVHCGASSWIMEPLWERG